MDKQTRNKMLALIHAQRRAAHIDDDSYKAILSEIAGVDSAAQVRTQGALANIVFALNEVLRKQGLPTMGRRLGRVMTPIQWATDRRAQKILGPHARERLYGYLEKIGKKRLEDCSDQELRRVNGFLSTLERKGNQNAEG